MSVVPASKTYLNECFNCSPIIDTDYLQNLQDKIDRKLAKWASIENSSRKNDLACKINTESFKKLNRYSKILTEMQFCNSCYSSFDIDSIVDLTKRTLV